MAYLATVASFGFADIPLDRLLPLYRRLGCEAAQFYRHPDHPPTPEHAKAVVADAGLRFDSIHGLFGPDLDPSSPDPAVRAFAVQTYREEAELARALGASCVVVHPAPAATDEADADLLTRSIDRPPHGLRAAGDLARRREALAATARELAAAADELGVRFALENLPPGYHFGDDAAALAETVGSLGHGGVGVWFDTGHAHLAGGVGAALDHLAPFVLGVHLNDNDARRDQHLLPGGGTIDWAGLWPRLQRLGGRVPLTLEVFPAEDTLRGYVEADGLTAAAAAGTGPRSST